MKKKKTGRRPPEPSPKTIFLGDSLPEDFSALADAFAEEETDPRSVFYKRILLRPTVRWGWVAVWLLVPPVCLAGARFLFSLPGCRSFFDRPGGNFVRWGALTAFFLLYYAVTAKKAAVCAVRVYQRLAPDSLREKCRFEPSCSAYMIGAIEKYGLFRGVFRGIRRLSRCKPPGGGFDPP